MEYRKFDHTYVVRIDRGEEVMAQLFKLMEKEKIRLELGRVMKQSWDAMMWKNRNTMSEI